MFRLFALSLSALILSLATASAADLRGSYVEARNCDVWTGPCFANADFNLTGKNAVLAWRVDRGSFEGVSLDGLGVVAVVAAHNTLGLDQTGPAKSVLIVDEKATSAQRDALVRFVQKQANGLLDHVVSVKSSSIDLQYCECKGNGCYELVAGNLARIKTRCIEGDHDKVCGNESAFYPPLARNVDVRPAGVVEHVFRGSGLGSTWTDCNGRGAYVGAFAAR